MFFFSLIFAVTTAENGQRALEYLGLVDDDKQSSSNDNVGCFSGFVDAILE